jgi:tetratricopeptide (TPR) repeat protein
MDKTKHAGTHRRANLKMGQNMMLIWLGNDVNDKNEDCHKMVTQLKHLGNTVHAFTDTDQCIDFVTDNYNENVFMIISDVSCQDSVPLIHDIIQLHTIFIFSEKQTKHEQWTKIWPKIKGISTVFLQISQAIKQASQRCEQNAMPISFMATDGDASNKNLDRLDPMFMYSQILKEILLTIQFKEQHIDEFIEYCRDIFDDNERAVKNVDQLKQKYHNQTPIWWYTYEGLLYPMLNHVLRTTDVDIIIKMGFFISDLHQHIEQLHKEQFGGHLTGKTFTVYRGQGLSSTDVDKLTTTKNGLLSFNNFLSTSKDREVSLAFAESNQCNPDLVGILFVMTIEQSKSTTPFAFINGVSYFDAENEVLFSMHTVFRIGKIQSIGNIHRLVQVDLTLMGEDDKDLRVLTDHIREETVPKSEGWYRLGEMLCKMGRFDKSQQVYEALLDQTTNETDKAAVYHQIAWVKCEQGVYEEALAFYDNANEILKSTLPSNHPDLASSYNNIGMVYQNMSEYSKALSYYEKALEIRQQSLPPNHPNLAHEGRSPTVQSLFSRDYVHHVDPNEL